MIIRVKKERCFGKLLYLCTQKRASLLTLGHSSQLDGPRSTADLQPNNKTTEDMSIDTYKLTSMEEPTDEVLSQLMKEAAEDAKQKRAEATARFFGQLKRESEKIAATC